MKRGVRVVLIVLGAIVIVLAIALIAAFNGMGYVRGMTVSPLDLTKAADAFNHLGLLDLDATPPRQKPAYAAFKLFVTTVSKK